MLRYLKKKVHGLARSPNFENGIAPPLGVLGRKFFVVLNNSLGGTSGPSMSKIGDVRVPNHFDPCWNGPIVDMNGNVLELRKTEIDIFHCKQIKVNAEDFLLQ